MRTHRILSRRIEETIQEASRAVDGRRRAVRLDAVLQERLQLLELRGDRVVEELVANLDGDARDERRVDLGRDGHLLTPLLHTREKKGEGRKVSERHARTR